MRDYSNQGTDPIEMKKRSIEQIFRVQHKSTIEGFKIKIDNCIDEVESVIQMHTNPINANLEDKLLMTVEKETPFLRWGSYITGYMNSLYMVVTMPTTTDGVVTKAKIREITSLASWSDDQGEVKQFPTISTTYLMYDDKTYVNDTKVFEDDDRRAIVLPYNNDTKKLKMIDTIYIDRVMYKILQIEHMYDTQKIEENGVLQMVLIRTTFGSIKVNGVKLEGIVRFARMKDKVLNSKSRELITYHNSVKSGDYVSHTYIRDENGTIENRNYIVRSLVDMRLGYDITYIINCDAEFYMWDNDASERKMIPCYVEDNRTRFREEWKPSATISGSEYQIIVQDNHLTSLLGEGIKRILIKGKAYEVVGTDNISLENAIYIGLKSAKVDPNRDNLELGIADYYEVVEKPPTSIGQIVGSDEMCLGETNDYQVEYDTFIRWSINSNIENLATIEEVNKNKCKVKVTDNYKYVGKTFELIGVISSMDEPITKTITVISW